MDWPHPQPEQTRGDDHVVRRRRRGTFAVVEQVAEDGHAENDSAATGDVVVALAVGFARIGTGGVPREEVISVPFAEVQIDGGVEVTQVVSQGGRTDGVGA